MEEKELGWNTPRELSLFHLSDIIHYMLYWHPSLWWQDLLGPRKSSSHKTHFAVSPQLLQTRWLGSCCWNTETSSICCLQPEMSPSMALSEARSRGQGVGSYKPFQTRPQNTFWGCCPELPPDHITLCSMRNKVFYVKQLRFGNFFGTAVTMYPNGHI